MLQSIFLPPHQAKEAPEGANVYAPNSHYKWPCQFHHSKQRAQFIMHD